jgi:hypothetical protein
MGPTQLQGAQEDLRDLPRQADRNGTENNIEREREGGRINS